MADERILLTTTEEVLKVFADHSGYKELGFDTETDSKKGVRANICGFSMSWEQGIGYYVPVAHYEGPNVPLEELLPTLNNVMATQTVVYHNAKYDFQVQDRAGIDRPVRWEDSMLAAHSLGTFDSLKLKELAMRILKIRMIVLEDLFGGKKKDINFPVLAPETAAPYAGADPDITLRIWKLLEPKARDHFIYKLEKEVMPFNCDAEWCGFKIDREYMNAEAKRMTEAVGVVADHLYALIAAALDIDAESARVMYPVNSYKKIGGLLYDKLGLECRKKTKSGNRSTDGDALNPYKKTNKIVANLLTVREMTRQRDSYYIKLQTFADENDRIHSDLNQCGASSGRWASSDPNLQNIPKKVTWKIYREDGTHYEFETVVRRSFVAEDGYYLFEMDQDQVELRFLAGAAQERTLLRAFARGEDLHVKTAAYMFGIQEDEVDSKQRDDGKTTNYALDYGMGPDHFYRELEGRYEMAEVEEMHRRYFELYSGIIPYHTRMRQETKITHSVTSYFGRYQRIPEFDLPGNWNRSKAERAGVARYVQGSCADMMKIIVARLMKRLAKSYKVATRGNLEGTDIRSVLYLHDGIYFELINSIDPVAFAEEIAKICTLEFPKFPVFRVSCKRGERWGREDMDDVEFTDPIPLREHPMMIVHDTKVYEEGETFVYALDSLTNQIAIALRELLKANPGPNIFELVLDGKALQISHKTSLAPGDASILELLGNPFKSDEDLAAEIAAELEIVLD